MRINHPRTGEYITTRCKGDCYCHHMAMVFGKNEDICENCGCPKTEKGWNEWKEKNMCGQGFRDCNGGKNCTSDHK